MILSSFYLFNDYFLVVDDVEALAGVLHAAALQVEDGAADGGVGVASEGVVDDGHLRVVAVEDEAGLAGAAGNSAIIIKRLEVCSEAVYDDAAVSGAKVQAVALAVPGEENVVITQWYLDVATLESHRYFCTIHYVICLLGLEKIPIGPERHLDVFGNNLLHVVLHRNQIGVADLNGLSQREVEVAVGINVFKVGQRHPFAEHLGHPLLAYKNSPFCSFFCIFMHNRPVPQHWKSNDGCESWNVS